MKENAKKHNLGALLSSYFHRVIASVGVEVVRGPTKLQVCN